MYITRKKIRPLLILFFEKIKDINIDVYFVFKHYFQTKHRKQFKSLTKKLVLKIAFNFAEI